MTNPLLTPFELPPFSKIQPEHVVPAVTKALNDCRENVERVVAQGAPYTWENLCQPLAEVDDVLGRIFSPVSHLNSVKNSPELREAYEQTLPLLSEYSTWVGQHEGLYKAYRDLRDGDHYATLSTAQKKAVDNALRDFELSGIGLPKEKQQRYGEIATRLSELGNLYSNNVLDATMGWTKLVTDEAELAGMPESALAAAKAQAEAKEQAGYLLTLDIPSYLPVMTYCDNQGLREEMYRAYSTRASDQGPNAGKWDNSPIMEEILALRHELAQLLGFESYAFKSLATKMAENPQQVLDFLTDLAKRARPQGEKELAQLRAFAKAEFGVDELQPWDIAYYSGRLGFVLFYDLERYLARPQDIVAVWQGGMSFHGGLVGAATGLVLFARRRGVPVLSVFDLSAAVVPIGLFLGRIANFINAELWGRPAPDVPWAMVFPHAGPVPRHPSQLYEAFGEGLVLFLLLALVVRAGGFRRPGLVAGVFGMGYALARIVAEFFREPDPQLGFLFGTGSGAGGGLTMGMLLSIPLFLAGLALVLRARRGQGQS